MSLKKIACHAAAAALFAALAPAAHAAPDSVAPSSGLDLANFDRSVRPQDDLFRYVNGAWLATDRIPPDRARFGAFDRLAEESENNVHAILEEAAVAKAGDAELRKAGDFYASYMDEAR
ncbi:MAG: hypothetical protein IT483_10525, partial [Gammaproteobacteria bacterium]|nr:hypothetical protein [Gammaproteobacteria bacterium]